MNSLKQKFLIIKLSSIGDIVHALPFLRTLRTNHPNAYIAWIIEESFQDLIKCNPDLDEVIPVRTKFWRKNLNTKSWNEICQTRKLLKEHRFDWTFDLQGLIKTGFIARMTGAPNRAGFHRDNCREKINAWFNNKPSQYLSAGEHIVDRCLSQLSVLGDFQSQVEFSIPIRAEDEHISEAFMKKNNKLGEKPIAGINPGAGFPTKLWSVERYAQLADRLTEELGFSVLLTWGPGEEEMVRNIADSMKQQSWIAPATTIAESIGLYKKLSLFVGSDSGPFHICWALGVPTVSVWGPTDPNRNGAYSKNHGAVFHKLNCSFCWERQCPLGTTECMDKITVQNVFEATKTLASEHVKMVISSQRSTH
ncbi:MAG TPA: lipopolysaccharide heptosyltransferase I [Nitrospinaceae bacterium]|jgi:lipopolysaccharide heptosyltransferase I|nr:lipopolysaccharide heptosyltransferase I [Nitrospinaceae bacterium]HIB43595.1 lipopolysaccharide heptosyltransferase I [Nitrospina sp.]